MPPPKKALSPGSRAKADKRNARLQAKRAADLAASGGAKSGKKKRKMTDLAEEEVPASGGGSSSSAPEFETTKKLCFDLLLDKEINLESKKLGLAKRRRNSTRGLWGWGCKIRMPYVNLLEWSDSEKAKTIEVLEKKYQSASKYTKCCTAGNKRWPLPLATQNVHVTQ
jgi:hypothetical protein